MNKQYFKEFVVGQKCIPWPILGRWRSFVGFIRVQRSMEMIDLEKTYESCFNDHDNLEDIIESKNYKYKSGLLKDSVYVKFLNHLKDNSHPCDDEIRTTEYYQATFKQIQTIGTYRGNRNETELLQQCRYFLDLYQAMKNGSYQKNYRHFIHIGINHSPHSYAWVFKIANSDHYIVWDGHHRLSCQYVLKKKQVKVRVAGVKKNRLQGLDYGEISD
jgi:hypothetical protein